MEEDCFSSPLPVLFEFSVFMPRRFYSAFSDVALEEINSEKVALNLLYKGQCVNTRL
jgi:hypothetical protein